MMTPRKTAHSQRGALMIEVLVAIGILAIGLGGLLQVQSRLQQSEMESYQRTQALILLNDMANRISTNRGNAADYVTANALGAGMNCPTTTATLQQTDFTQWCNALQGAAEQTTSDAKVGTMIGGRGCIADVGTLSEPAFRVTVVWQGLTPISAPPATITCGAALYNDSGTATNINTDCVNDLCRRYVTTHVRIGTL
jgi:type IV pilus assembly protein PilV